MKILRLQGENIKKMKAFDITPKGNTVVLSGKNGAGKSSVLDSITLLLAGKRSEAATLTTKPIRSGEKHAHVTADLGKYTVRRTWTEKDTYLEIVSKDGAAYKSPQAMLDSIIGELSFDPMQFARMTPKQQREALLSIVKLPIDLDKWDADYKAKYAERTAANNEVKKAKALVDAAAAVPAETPDAEIGVTDLMSELETALKNNRDRETLEEAEKHNIGEIARLERELGERRVSLHKIQETLGRAPAKVDVGALQEKIKQADGVNANVRAKLQNKKNAEQLVAAESVAGKLDTEIENMKTAKDAALLQASFPVPGLGLSDDGVTFKQGDTDIPFAQLSTALQTKISMGMAMAANPELKVIRISDGSLLDDDTMKAINEMAEKNDYQVWIEQVDSSGTVGIFIEDGEVKADNSPAAA